MYSGIWGYCTAGLAVAWALFQITAVLFGGLDAITLRAWHVLLVLVMAFLLSPVTGKRAGTVCTRPPVVACISALLAAGAFGYLLCRHTDIALSGGFLQDADYAAATVGVLICFVAAWRVVPGLAWLALIFFLYNFAGAWIPGLFGNAGFSWQRVVEHMFWSDQGLLGQGAGVSATYVFMFVLFGAFLRACGFSELLNDTALALVGRSPGGPAKVAVLASAAMGMVNGSAIANVAATGALTIPMMKRAGYKAEFAAAVEAAASTGGQFSPPVMGAVGFLMAEFLGLPYTHIMLAAAIPAFLYYLALLMSVHFEARKRGLKGLSAEHIPALGACLRGRWHLFLPLAVLLGALFGGFTPLYAAALGIGACVAASWLRVQTRMGLRDIVAALESGAKGAVGVGVACMIIGIVIGTVSLSGLGVKFAYAVLRYMGEGQLLLGGLCVMLVSVILGMGVPGVAAYVIVSTVAVPVLTDLGAVPLAAHMFCLIYACLSNITPPVAVASYVAASIARSNQAATSVLAVKLGLIGFLVPFFFLDAPQLLYTPGAGLLKTLPAFITATLGAAALASGVQGWLLTYMARPMRLLLVAAACLFLHAGLFTDAAGLAACAVAVVWQWKKTRCGGAC